MSNNCQDTNPCAPCADDCLESNPCYENCGCLNPTTFECVTLPGAHPELGITNDMNGVQAFAAIGVKVADLQEQIDNIEVGEPAEGVDVHVKVSAADTTAGYLNDKIAVDNVFLKKKITFPSGNEKVHLYHDINGIISEDAGNLIIKGTDGKLKVIGSGSSGIYLEEGAGVTITGDGSIGDPYIISTNPSISAAEDCYDGTWKNVTLGSIADSDVVYVSGTPKYRIRHDGTIEFKGTVTYTVNFGTYDTTNRKHTATIGAIATSCLSLVQQSGTTDLKSISYIDAPQAGADQITQSYNYIIRKANQNIVIEFQSSFSNITTKTIVVSFDGAVSHPEI